MGTKPGELAEEEIKAAVSDDADREILAVCIGEPRSVKAISDATGIPLATVYRHVDKLNEAGLLIVERSAISEEGKRYDLYRSRLVTILLKVSEDGVEVAWTVERSVEERIARMWEQMRL